MPTATGCKNAFDQLLFPRVPLRYALPRRSWWLAPAPVNRQASGSEKRSSSMRQPPRRGRHHPPRDGSINFVEEYSVPEGKAKSEQAPIRRPPLRAEGHCTGARPSGLFFWTVHGPFSFRQDRKENGGCIPLDKPPGGSQTPEAAVRRPQFPRGVPQKERALPFIFPQTRTRTPSR